MRVQTKDPTRLQAVVHGKPASVERPHTDEDDEEICVKTGKSSGQEPRSSEVAGTVLRKVGAGREPTWRAVRVVSSNFNLQEKTKRIYAESKLRLALMETFHFILNGYLKAILPFMCFSTAHFLTNRSRDGKFLRSIIIILIPEASQLGPNASRQQKHL
ncbi:hypothetical protein AVEN_239887-1 [Araneus ventricosus]|uniref:Uncharacterized protein n=1 Tax=Araneus ventricosus TaxID=182803 RepID=A0A4Y2L8H1_ARAVE|nr:hypothetical protein AVEN_239887-1 [Araneus ventricosus]